MTRKRIQESGHIFLTKTLWHDEGRFVSLTFLNEGILVAPLTVEHLSESRGERIVVKLNKRFGILVPEPYLRRYGIEEWVDIATLEDGRILICPVPMEHCPPPR